MCIFFAYWPFKWQVRLSKGGVRHNQDGGQSQHMELHSWTCGSGSVSITLFVLSLQGLNVAYYVVCLVQRQFCSLHSLAHEHVI